MGSKYDLKGWNAIADYLGVGVCTVRKWARLCELPITQITHRGTVMASRVELEEWKKSHRYDKKPEAKRLDVSAVKGIM